MKLGARGQFAWRWSSLDDAAVRAVVLHAASIVIAVGCWVLALRGARPGDVSGWGLLGVLPFTFLLGLVVLAVGFVAAASSKEVQPAVLAAYVVVLAAMLTATTALLYPEPRYAWVYKHFGIIDYIRLHGSADRQLSIYTNWPAFFALNAWLSDALGISPLRYANWAQFGFDLANLAAVLFVVRGLTRDARTQWTAVWLFEIANWIGQDYLSPQAFSFVLALVAIGLLVRCSPMRSPPRSRIDRWLEARVGRLASWLLRGRVPRRRDAMAPPLAARAGLIVTGLCYLGVVLTHQLAPVFVIIAAATLCVAARRPSPWVVVAMVAVEAWWVGLAYPFLSGHFSLFSIAPPTSARLTLASAEHPLTGVRLSADLSGATIVLIVLVAAAGVLRGLRRGRWDPAPIVLAGGPFVVIALQSYGGEGPLRAYLFALPWLAYLAASAVAPRPDAALARRAWRLLVVTIAVGGCSLTGLFGQESTNYYTADDVAAARWNYDHAQPGGHLYYLMPNFPGPVDANFARNLTPPQSLVQIKGFPHTLPAIERLMGSGPAYLTLSPAQQRYALLDGLISQPAYLELLRQLAQSPDFTLAYRHGSAFVFALVR